MEGLLSTGPTPSSLLLNIDKTKLDLKICRFVDRMKTKNLLSVVLCRNMGMGLTAIKWAIHQDTPKACVVTSFKNTLHKFVI